MGTPAQHAPDAADQYRVDAGQRPDTPDQPATAMCIEVEHLVKTFGALRAVDDVSFSVRQGELFGFLGPNGAGKTTAINVLCTLLRPTAGNVLVNGYSVRREPHLVRRSIGIIFQDPSLDDRLTALENLEFHARMYNVPRAIWQSRAEELLRMVELWDRRHDIVRSFSGGMRRRLEVARSLLHRPEVLFLDEPTLGLDPQSREHIWRYFLDLRAREGISLFLTTHYLDEAERCDRIAIIDHGRIVALDTPDRLKARVGGDILTIETVDPDGASASLAAKFSLQAVRADGRLRVEVADGAHFIPRLVAELDTPIQGISLRRPTLEDVFLAVTGTALRDEEAAPSDRMRAWARARRG